MWVIGVVGYISVAGAALAFHFASVATVTFLLLLVPLFAALLAPLYGERCARRQLMALGIGLVGVACFAAPSTPFADEWRGIALALLASVTLALNWHQNRSLARQPGGAVGRRRGANSGTRRHRPDDGRLRRQLADRHLLLAVAGGGRGRVRGQHRAAPVWPAVDTRQFGRAAGPISAITSSLLALVVLGQRPDALTLLGAAIIVGRRGSRSDRAGSPAALGEPVACASRPPPGSAHSQAGSSSSVVRSSASSRSNCGPVLGSS